MKTTRQLAVTALLLTAISGCNNDNTPDVSAFKDPGADSLGFTAATATTETRNQALAGSLPIHDQQDFADARRGFIASDDDLNVTRGDGSSIWRPADYAFIKGDSPATVNPSLWRQATLNDINGLFQVTDRVYQVRGYDLANMTIIEGDKGRILVDPLTAAETATAALKLVERNLGERPISAIIFTHSHIDHFGGVDGILQHLPAGATPPRIIAPLGFMHESVSENVLAGTVMMRRAGYMYGSNLPKNPRGHVGSGLGKHPAIGTVSIAVPTDTVDHTGQTLTVDGVDFYFQYVPDSEAPAEMTFLLPQFRVWCGAEMVTHNLHNLYTLRGAKVRDALKWSDYIQQAIDLFGDRADVLIISHHWPVWNDLKGFLAKQRDAYKFIHDQTLHLAGKGYTPGEIADELQLPSSLAANFATRDYYGTAKHNARAVYQYYFGWFDGNPAHLDPLPESVTAGRYVNAMGGQAAVKTKAKAAFEKGDYRWAAELLNHAVFADDSDAEARELLARCYDQLGYQAESGPWRDEYLTGALELRHGVQTGTKPPDKAKILSHIPLEQFFLAIETLIDGKKADGKHIVANFNFTDVNEQYVLWVENAVLHHRKNARDEHADFTVTLTRDLWIKLLTKQAGLKDLLLSDDFHLDGDKLDLVDFLGLLDPPDENFAILTP